MSSPEIQEDSVSVLTTPEIWITGSIAAQTPYKKIIGVNMPDGSEIRTPDHNGPQAMNGPRVQEEPLPASCQMSERLVQFLGHFMSTAKNYNCHVFGDWMRNGSLSSFSVIEERAKSVIKDGVITTSNLKLGQLGVLGCITKGRPNPIHSVIGLGEEVDSCLQVMWFKSHLGIVPYGELLEFYGRRKADFDTKECIAQLPGEHRRGGLLRKMLRVSTPALYVSESKD